MADPNWFYSTLAQSTAAIVGLAGGFLVQYLLAQRASVTEKRSDLHSEFDMVWVGIHQVRTAAASAVRDMRELRERALGIGPEGTLDGLHFRDTSSLSHSVGNWADEPIPSIDAQQAVFLLERAIPCAEALRDALPESEEAFEYVLNPSTGLSPLPESAAWLQEPQHAELSTGPDTFWTNLGVHADYARNMWQGLVNNQVKPLARQRDTFAQRLVPTSFYWLLGILIGLLCAGVIAPLFYLSARDGASRPVLLTFFIPLSIGFVVYIGYELWRLRRAAILRHESF